MIFGETPSILRLVSRRRPSPTRSEFRMRRTNCGSEVRLRPARGDGIARCRSRADVEVDGLIGCRRIDPQIGEKVQGCSSTPTAERRSGG